MTTITENIANIAGVDDTEFWAFSSPLRRNHADDGVVSTGTVYVQPVDGVLTVELDPGPAIVQVGARRYTITVPESDTGLWSLIQASVEVPPATTDEKLAAAVAAWLEDHPIDGGPGGSSDLVDDTSPQLGGDLDLNGHSVGTASAADLTKLHDVTATAVELNHVDGVTAPIQGQLDGKQATIAPGTTVQYRRGDSTWQTLDQDAVPDSATRKALTAAERTKLTGIATSATANASDAALRDRTTHTGLQTSATISDFAEAAQDAVAAMLVATGGASLSYNDAANTLTINTATPLDAEGVRDLMGIAILGSGLINVTVNDALDTITISTTATANSTDAALRDRSTHTGTQAQSTIVDLVSDLGAKYVKPVGGIPSADLTGAVQALLSAAGTAVQPAALTKAAVGLGAVDNTADLAKPVSAAQQAALDTKQPAGFTPCEVLAAGFTTVPRVGTFANFAPASGQLRLSYFTAPVSRTCNGITVATGTTAAGATPTMIRFGVWLVDGNGDLTLVASTPNDTTLLAAANTAYTKAFSAPYAFVAGQRYAWSPLVVTAATMPNFGGVGGVNNAAESAVSPRSSGLVGSQTDLPSSIGNATPVGSAIGQAYARFT